MKIIIRADVPDDLLQAWMQHLRDFDSTHPGCCHFKVTGHTELSTSEVMEMLDIDPPLATKLVVPILNDDEIGP